MKRLLSLGIILLMSMTVFLTGCEDSGNDDDNRSNDEKSNKNNPPADTTKPTITSTNPKHGEKNIDPMPTITLEFSERMKMTIGNVQITSPVPRGVQQELEWEHSQKVKIHIKDGLDFNTKYTFEIRDFIDEAGNSINPYTLSFTIRAPTSVTIVLHEMKSHLGMDDWSAPDLYAKLEANGNYKYTSTYEDTYSATPEYKWETTVDEYPEEVVIRIYDEDVSDDDYIGGITYSGTYADHREYDDNAIYVCYSVWYT